MEENGFYSCWTLWHHCSGSDSQCLSKSKYCISNFPYLHADKCFGRAIVFATKENKEPIQNNDGSGEIGLSVPSLHWGRRASLSWLWWCDQRFCICKEKDCLNCVLHCKCMQNTHSYLVRGLNTCKIFYDYYQTKLDIECLIPFNIII